MNPINAILLLATALASAPSFAHEIVIKKDAVIFTCPKDVMGCAPSISFDQGAEDALLDQSYSQAILKKHGHLQSEDAKSIDVREAMGILVEEKGHFPNPMVKRKVFKPIRIIE